MEKKVENNVENKENDKNSILVDIIMRQTNYTKEIAAEKLVQHKHDILSIIREYMSSQKKEIEEKTKSKSTSQLIYGEIRNMMGSACANYRRKKELEEYRKARIEQVQTRMRIQAHINSKQNASAYANNSADVSANDISSIVHTDEATPCDTVEYV